MLASTGASGCDRVGRVVHSPCPHLALHVVCVVHSPYPHLALHVVDVRWR